MDGFFSWLNPARPGGLRVPHYLALILVAVVALVVAFGAGWLTRGQSDRFTGKGLGLPLPVVRHAPVSAPRVKTLPVSAAVNIARYPAVGDQDGMGACAAWASTWDAAYEWRILHPSSNLRFSPRQAYDHYSDTYNNGQDGGSWFDQDLEISSTTGLLQFKALPMPPYQIDDPIPTYDAWGHLTATDAAKHRFVTTFHPLQGFSQGGGAGLVASIKATIVSGHPVMIGFPVYPEYDAVTNGLIDSPSSGEGDRGGHGNVILAYDDTIRFPSGHVGGVEIQNQWGTGWGLSGRAWMSYDFVEKYVFGSEWLSITSMTSTRSGGRVSSVTRGGADGGKSPIIPSQRVFSVRVPRPPHVGGSGWYVKRYISRDSHRNIAPILNASGDHWGIWPVYLLAVTLAESGGNQYAQRWGQRPDISFGYTQVTTSTLTGYHRGCGLVGDYCARSYLWVGWHSVKTGAHILRDYRRETGVGYPGLWQCYNAGPGSCRSPYYAAFLQSYYLALSYRL